MGRSVISGANRYIVTLPAMVPVAILALWFGVQGLTPQVARDFEECVEQVEANTPSKDKPGASMICGAQFAARRKPGGGYAYYDFMQDKTFYISGPNPTVDECRRIDLEYMHFLDTQRREALSADLARARSEELQLDIKSAPQPVRPPIILTRPAPVPLPAKRPTDRSKYARCEDGSLSCRWLNFSAAVKNAFASSSNKER
jgi:hypothetical protein